MMPLPFDIARCDPEHPDHYCNNCKLYIKHPKQQMGQRTPVILVETSASESCCYRPVSHQAQPKRALYVLHGHQDR
jgi:hypothetical protein